MKKRYLALLALPLLSGYGIFSSGQTVDSWFDDHVIAVGEAIEQCEARFPDQKLLATATHNKFVEIERNHPVATCVANTVHNNSVSVPDADTTRRMNSKPGHRGNVNVYYNVVTNEYRCDRFEGLFDDDSNVSCYNKEGYASGFKTVPAIFTDSYLASHRNRYVKETLATLGDMPTAHKVWFPVSGYWNNPEKVDQMEKAMLRYDNISRVPEVKNDRIRVGMFDYEPRYISTGTTLNVETGKWSCTVKEHETREWAHRFCPGLPAFAQGRGPA